MAAFFDLDKTIIAKSSTLAFSRPFFDEGLINRRSVLKSSYAQFLFLLTAADADQVERLRKHVTQMCAGWDVDQVRTIVAETLHDIVDPLVFAEAAELIAGHRARGHDVVIVSASGSEIVEPIGEMLGVDTSVASRMQMVDGKYSGEVEFYCYGEGKRTAIREIAGASADTTSICASPTRIRSPICRCSRWSDIRPRSIPTARCARPRPRPAGPSCRSIAPSRCGKRIRGRTVAHHRNRAAAVGVGAAGGRGIAYAFVHRTRWALTPLRRCYTTVFDDHRIVAVHLLM